LLVSDVVLPKMGGREVAERVRASHASVKTLFVSGYAGEAIVERGQWGDAPLLPKPFTPGELARRVRARLDEPGAARG
jgi:DNA-binding response OmpR family regulator